MEKVQGSTEKMLSSIRTRTREKNKRTGKKKLNYNHREVSSLLMRANRSQSASSALSVAKNRLGSLKRAAASGQYNKAEVDNALAHAKRMVQCAQLKVKNLKQEEMERKKRNKEHAGKVKQSKNEAKRRVAQKEKDAADKVAAKQLEQLRQIKRQKQELQRIKRSNRSTENGKIMEADMKYLQGLGNHNSGTVEYQSIGTAATLQISGFGELQLEQQIEQELGISDLSTDVVTEGINVDVSVGGGMTMPATQSAMNIGI